MAAKSIKTNVRKYLYIAYVIELFVHRSYVLYLEFSKCDRINVVPISTREVDVRILITKICMIVPPSSK